MVWEDYEPATSALSVPTRGQRDAGNWVEAGDSLQLASLAQRCGHADAMLCTRERLMGKRRRDIWPDEDRAPGTEDQARRKVFPNHRPRIPKVPASGSRIE